jgi:hypothetical protein
VLIQKQIESLRALRLLVIRWPWLTGQLVWWIPFLVVVLKGLWDVDAYRVLSVPFLIANVALGLALIPAAVWVSRKFAGRMDGFPVVQWLMRELGGYNINPTSDSLAALAEFEHETRY